MLSRHCFQFSSLNAISVQSSLSYEVVSISLDLLIALPFQWGRNLLAQPLEMHWKSNKPCSIIIFTITALFFTFGTSLGYVLTVYIVLFSFVDQLTSLFTSTLFVSLVLCIFVTLKPVTSLQKREYIYKWNSEVQYIGRFFY